MIYLDNAATSFPKPEPVYQALDRFARASLANPGRSAYRMSREAEATLDAARLALNTLYRGDDPRRWVFTYNGTDALNIAIKGTLRPGDHVITSDLEHNSVSRPLVALERAGTITLTRIASRGGTIDPADVRRACRPRTRLVALTHAANVLGTLQPVEAIAPIVRDQGALFLVDAAQTAGVVALDLQATPLDLLAFPGHKALMGPTGTGALYVGPRADLSPWREGGTGGDSRHPIQPDELPHRLEGGTPNVLGVAGLRAGVRWVAEQGVENARRHEVALLQKIVDWTESSPAGWTVAGSWDPARHVGALSLIVPDPDALDPQELVTILDGSFGIAVRGGLHCAPYAHRAIGTFPHGTIRVSPGPFNTEADIERLLAALDEVTASVL